MKRISSIAGAVVLAAGLSLPAAAQASASPRATCSFHYSYYLNNPNALGSYAQLTITSSNCGAGWPLERAHLVCVGPRGGELYTFYGVTVRPGVVSTAHCNSSSEPDYLDGDVQYANGAHQTYRAWTR